MTVTTKKPRKKRSDRNHIIYEIRLDSMAYVGMTYVEKASPIKSLRRRWQKHVRRALTERKDWKLCKAIRKHGPDAFEVQVLEIVRGKTEAHVRERQLIQRLKPSLNTDVRTKRN